MKTIVSFYKLLGKSDKKSVMLLAFLITISMILETLSIGSILPLLLFITNGDGLESSSFINKLYIYFPIINSNNIFIVIITTIFLSFSFKFFFLLYQSYYQSKLAANITRDWSNKLFKNYLSRSYKFHLKNNSSVMIKNIVTETNQLLNFIIVSTSVIAELAIMFGITTFLILLQPKIMTIILLTTIFLFFLANHKVKHLVSNFGKDRHKFEGERLQYLSQSFDTIKDIKMLALEESFEKQFSVPNKNLGIMQLNWNFTKLIPKIVIEYIVIFFGLFGLLIAFNFNNNLLGMIPTLGIFALALFRIIPSFQRIILGLTTIRVSEVIIDMFKKEFAYKEKTYNHQNIKNNVISFQNDILIKDLFFSYNDNNIYALNNININLSINNMIGIVGESGSGKTTMVDVLSGLLDNYYGEIIISGEIINTNSPLWRSNISYVPQNYSLIDDTIIQNIALGINPDEIDLNRINEIIEIVELKETLDKFPEGLNTYIGEKGVRISGGQKQRIAIARSLYRDTKILILDESTSALDYKIEKRVISNIKNTQINKLIIIITHRLDSLKYCDKIFEFVNGDVLEISKEDILSKKLTTNYD